MEAGGKLYAIPCNADQILVLDLATQMVSGIYIPSLVGASYYASNMSAYKWSGGVVADGKVFGIPCMADHILVLDLATQVVSGIKVPDSIATDVGSAAHPGSRSRSSLWSGGVLLGGMSALHAGRSTGFLQTPRGPLHGEVADLFFLC